MNGQYKHKMEINSVIRQVMESAKPSELEGILYYQDQIAEVAKLVAEHEREACAKVAFVYDAKPWKHEPAYAHVADMVSVGIGKAIRARSCN